MKKLLTVLILIASTQFVRAQKIENLAENGRVYLWDKPVTDGFNYKGVLPGNMHPVVVYTAMGTRVLALFNDEQFIQAQGYFTDSFMTANSSRIVGYEYVVMYIGKFSWMTKGQLRKLSGMQKVTAKGFNSTEKYTLMAQAPRTVLGTREAGTGKILLAGSTPEPQPASPERPVDDASKKVETKKFNPPAPGGSDKKTEPAKTIIPRGF